jgi:hypothetical protein
MEPSIWKHLREWLQHAASSDMAFLPPEDVCRTIARDAANRGMLALLMAELFDVTPMDTQISVQQCQDDLAAFIDLEASNGARAAIQAYPHVWWHLWIDPEFAEVYRLTISMNRAEQRGEMPALTLPEAPVRQHRHHVMAQINLRGAFLSRAFSTQTLLGAARGADTDTPLVVEEEESACTISLSVHKKPGDIPRLAITVTPPVEGRIVLVHGEKMLEAPFDAQGVAVIELLPTQFFPEHHDLDLIVRIEADDVDDAAIW